MQHNASARFALAETTRENLSRIANAATACLSLAYCATILLPQHALAQAPSARPCTEIENDAERLACYDRSLRPARPAATAAAPAAAPPAPTAAAAPAAPTELGTAREVEPRQGRDARAAAPSAPATPASPAAPAAVAADPTGIVPIVIVEVRTLAGRNDKVFTTDGGAVWVQTDNVKLNYPEPPFPAQIKPGMMGSFFLATGAKQRAVRVRRNN